MTHDPTLTAPEVWRGRFDALIRDRMRAPFAWGTHDCCLFAADAVLAKSGFDPAADLRGTYSTALEAARVVDRLGGMEATGARCGSEINPLMAGIGDVGLVANEGRDCLAVCTGEVWLAPAESGLGMFPITAATKAWRVACLKQQ